MRSLSSLVPAVSICQTAAGPDPQADRQKAVFNGLQPDARSGEEKCLVTAGPGSRHASLPRGQTRGQAGTWGICKVWSLVWTFGRLERFCRTRLPKGDVVTLLLYGKSGVKAGKAEDSPGHRPGSRAMTRLPRDNVQLQQADRTQTPACRMQLVSTQRPATRFAGDPAPSPGHQDSLS